MIASIHTKRGSSPQLPTTNIAGAKDHHAAYDCFGRLAPSYINPLPTPQRGQIKIQNFQIFFCALGWSDKHKPNRS